MKTSFLVSFLLCSIISIAQTKQSTIDTATLFNPSGEEVDIMDIMQQKNLVLFNDKTYNILAGDSGWVMSTQQALGKYFTDSVVSIRKKRFYIIVNGTQNFEGIVNIIDLLKKAGITNYQVFDVLKRQRPPEAVAVISPTQKNEKRNLDSTYLKIDIQQNNYKVSFLSDSLITDNIDGIDNFITSRQSKINANKILLQSIDNASYGRFKAVKDILKKNGFERFFIVTKTEDE